MIESGAGTRKTVTRSFRVDGAALRTIEEDAAQANVSVNTFVNQLFLSYAKFERYGRKFHNMKIITLEAEHFLSLLSDEEAAEAGRYNAQNIAKPIILAKYGSVDLGTILAYLGDLAEYGNQFSYSISETGGKRTVTLVHTVGRKGSIFYSNIVAALFESVKLRPLITTTDSAVTVSI